MKPPGNLQRVVILFLFLGQVVSAQPYRFRHLTIEDGLSQSSVNCMMQDSRGFMWFGTQDGLDRYDGYQFRVFRYDPADSNTISHNWIWDLCEDRQGRIWIATWKGLSRYDPGENRFVRFLPDSSNPSGISGERPASVCMDPSGNIWIGIWGGGVDRYVPETNGFVKFFYQPENKNSLPGNFVRCVFFDSKGRLWVGTWSGLALGRVSEDGSVDFVRFVHDEQNPVSLGNDHVMSVLEDHAGRIWIGTRGGGLNLFNEKDSSFVRYEHHKGDPAGISSNDVCSLYEDPQNRFWIGTFTEGLNLFDTDKGTFTRILHDPEDPGSLLGNNVYSLLEDRSGLLWIGAGGLNILDPRVVAFRHYSYGKKEKNSLSSNDVTAFYEDDHGRIWIGTNGGGLNCLDRRKNIFTVYRHDPHDPYTLASDHVSAVTGDDEGKLWVATSDNGLFRFDPVKEKFMPVINIAGISPEDMKGLRYINDLCFTQDNVLWIASDNAGLVRYDLTKNAGTCYKEITWGDRTLMASSLLTLLPDSRGTLWIGTWGIGLFSLDMKNEKFTVYPTKEEDPSSVSGNMVHDICETTDSAGRILWVGTNRGLCWMRPDGPSAGRFMHITMKDGLPSNIVYGILQDDQGKMWISTNNGLSRFDPATGEIRNFDMHDGLQNNEFNLHSCLKLKDGTLLFGGVNGFNMFDPEMIRENDYQPPVVLTGFRVFNREMTFGKDLTEIRQIVLTWKQNFFSFEFAALDFAQPEKIRYAYRMVGVDQDWVYSGNRRYASYTRIDPGEYLFEAKATNRDGVWSDRLLKLRVKIRPPFWRTWWFKMLGVLAFFLLLYALHRIQLEKLLAVERLRVRIASDLHDDVGSALTRISIASEQLQVTKDQSRLMVLSRTIGNISREIISTMSDIIWSIDARNDTLDQLTARMQDLALSALSVKNIKVTFHEEGMKKKKKKKIPVDHRQNIFYIFKEVVNNIVKHADASEVKIDLQNNEKGFTMRISDNGKGFDPERIKRGNGLRNIRMRAERLKAKLEIETDQGVSVVLRMKRL